MQLNKYFYKKRVPDIQSPLKEIQLNKIILEEI